jgi:iron complex outermembrane receptor protein
MTPERLSMRCACLAVLLTAVALRGYAQSEDSIVVDALRFTEDARRLPANVTVIGQDDIAKSAARTLPELLQEQVGITMKDFFGNNAAATSVDMRGFGVSGGQNTLILVDGRRLTDPDLTSPQWSSIPLAGVERIEIVRGAGSVLYGDGATAGVINIVTRSPLKEGAAVDGYGRIASFHTREGQLYGSTTAGNFGLNASVYGYGSDGYRDNNRNEQKNGTANLRWALGATTLDLRLGADNQNLGLPGARFVQPSIGLNEYKSDPRGAQTPQDKASRDGRRAGVSLAHMLGDSELLLGVDWRKKKEEADYEQRFVSLDTRLSVLSLTPRVRVPFRFGGLDHRLTVGADWNSWDYDSRRDNPAGDLDQPVNRIRARQKNAALYFQDLVELSRATRLSLGWRRERVRYDAKDKLDTTAPGFCPPPFFICQAAAAPASATKHENAWDLGLRHNLTREVAAYARAGRSFRFANIDEVYDFDTSFNPQFQILKPQHSLTYEGGLEWRAGGTFLRASLFRIDVKDEIHLDPFTAGVGNTNLPPSRRQGVELNGAWQATSSLRLTAAYAYTDARYLKGTFPGGPFVIAADIDIAGNYVPLVPKHKLNSAFAWDIGGGLRLSGALWAASKQYMDNDEANSLGVRIPGTVVADLKLAQSFGWGNIAFTVNNLFSERYYTYAIRSQFTADRYAVYPLPQRTVGVIAEFRM